MPAPENLAMFVIKLRKRLGGLTVDTYTLNRLYLMAITEMSEALGEGEANRRIFEWGYAMGHSYLLKMRGDVERLPVNAKSVKLLGRSAWYIFSGGDPEVLMEEKPAEGGNYIVARVRDRRSPWAEGIKAGRRVCHYPTGAYEGASNTFALISGRGSHYAIARETACLAAGDPYCELTVVYVPSQTPRERVVEDFPELFEELDMGFSAELHRKYFGD